MREADRPPEHPSDLWGGGAGSAEPMGAPILPEPSSSLPVSVGAAHGALPLLGGKNTATRTARFAGSCEDALRYDFNNSGAVGKRER